MSKEELKRFRQDVRGNAELKKKLRQAKKQAVQEAIRVFAAASGYIVVAEDFVKPDKKAAKS